VVGDVVVVGAAHRPAGGAESTWDVRGYVRGYDVRTGERSSHGVTGSRPLRRTPATHRKHGLRG
jgi:hypothetical protein